MTENEITPGSLVQYCRSIADEFKARQHRISSLVKHNLTTGTARETIVRDFLAEHCTGHYKVVQGFICDPTQIDRVSRQCDILVYNHLYHPVIHSEGQIKVVWSISVQMVIEVKTKLNKDTLYRAIENVRAAKALRSRMTGLVFAFESIGISGIIEHLESYAQDLPMMYAPHAILVLDKKLLIESNNIWTPTGERDVYQVREADNEGVLMTYLFLVFLANVTEPTLCSLAVKAAQNLLVQQTKVVSTDLRIGARRE